MSIVQSCPLKAESRENSNILKPDVHRRLVSLMVVFREVLKLIYH